MYDERHFSRDVATVQFHDDSGITVDDGGTSFDWSDVEIAVIDDVPYAEQFDSSRFYRLDATVAKPIAQPYQYGEDTVWLKKPRDELQQAAWSLDNAPWTLGHPDTGMVKSVDDVHGFWTDPTYHDSRDDLNASLMIPVEDREATKFLEQNDDVSVGFYNKIARTDDYDGVVGGTDSGDIDIEGYQTDLLFDHCASVAVGRCPSEAGCGLSDGRLSADSAHGHLDATTSMMAKEGQTHDAPYSVGDWVQWDASGGTAHGKVDEVVREGCTTRGKGDMEVCAEEDDAVAVVEVYDDETGDSRDEMVRHKMSTLSSWSGPSADSVPIYVNADESDIDMEPPEAAQENAQMALDAREETGNPNDCGTEVGWRRANQLADGGEVSAEVISKMAQFNRHRSNSEQSAEEGNEDCGWMMWKAWGGDEGVDWAIRQSEKMESSDAFKSVAGTTDLYDETAMNVTVDAPAGLYVAEGTWFAVGPDDHPDDSTEWPGDAKYPVDSCEDISDAWNLRGTGDISIEQSTLAERIKRAAEAKGCDLPTEDVGSGRHSSDESGDLPDTAEMDAIESAKGYSICGSRKDVMRDELASLAANAVGVAADCGCDDDTTTDTMEFEFDDLSTAAALAKVESQHDGVSERLEELRESTDAAEAAAEATEELGLDTVDDLTDKVALITEQNDDLRERVEELQRPQMEEDAAFIAEQTDRFGDDVEEVLDTVGDDADALAEKRELVEDLIDGYQETTANADAGGDGGEAFDSGQGYAKSPW